MKLLVLAQTPPPLHGQSLMVRTLVDGLPATGDFEIHHVNLSLSRDGTDIGRWRPGKLPALIRACRQALLLRRQHGPMALYYVPAPGKFSAVLRDWIVMYLCRQHFSHLILHWHAVGLGTWLARTNPINRALTLRSLRHADLSLVLSPTLAPDTAPFNARATLSVPNGIPDPGPPPPRPHRRPHDPCRLLFLGLCSEEKGLFDLLDALALAHARQPNGFHLTIAGGFPDASTATRFRSRAASLGPIVRHAGFADETAKRQLFQTSDIFCFPTRYPHEGQPLVLIEALAHDVPIVTTRWRAIPAMLPPDHTWLVAPGRPDQLCDTLCAARTATPAAGSLREYYLAHYTRDRHLASLASALLSLAPDRSFPKP